MIKKSVKEKSVAKGVYRFTKAFLEKPEHFALSQRIQDLKDAGLEYIHLVRELNKMCRTQVWLVDNIVPTVGRANIANNMTDATPTNSLLVNYFAVGTGNATPANGDTVLDNEVYRNAVASRTNAANVAYITGFLNATEDADTYLEAGLFADGTGSVDTGILMSRVAINITKSLTETLTIDWTFTIL